jgi:hypothetical protein
LIFPRRIDTSNTYSVLLPFSIKNCEGVAVGNKDRPPAVEQQGEASDRKSQ